MFAPGLGQRLQFDIEWIATAGGEVVADGDQLLRVEGERSSGVEVVQAGIIKIADWNGRGRRHVVSAWVEDGLDAVRCPALDHGVGDDPAHQGIGGRTVATRRELDAPPGRRSPDGNAELPRGVDDGVGGRIGDTRVKGDLDSEGVAVCGGEVPRCRLQQRVGQEGGEATTIIGVEIALDEGDVADRDRAGQVEVVGRRGSDDGRFSRVVTDCLDGQSRPGWHCSDPTTPIA